MQTTLVWSGQPDLKALEALRRLAEQLGHVTLRLSVARAPDGRVNVLTPVITVYRGNVALGDFHLTSSGWKSNTHNPPVFLPTWLEQALPQRLELNLRTQALVDTHVLHLGSTEVLVLRPVFEERKQVSLSGVEEGWARVRYQLPELDYVPDVKLLNYGGLPRLGEVLAEFFELSLGTPDGLVVKRPQRGTRAEGLFMMLEQLPAATDTPDGLHLAATRETEDFSRVALEVLSGPMAGG